MGDIYGLGAFPETYFPDYPDAYAMFDFTRGRYRLNGVSSREFTPAKIAGLTVTRATPSVAYAETAAGVLVPFAAHEARITDKGLLVEEARTKKNTEANLNPQATTNLSGGGVAVTTCVDDTTNLAAIGLSGNVYKVDNSAGGSPVFVNLGGTTGNTNKHSLSLYWRGGTGAIAAVDTSPASVTAKAVYTRVTSENVTPANSSSVAYIRVDAGQVVYFVLQTWVEATFCLSPIPGTSTGTVTRAADGVQISGLTVTPSSVTLAVKADLYVSSDTTVRDIASLSDGTSSNQLRLVRENNAAAYGYANAGGALISSRNVLGKGGIRVLSGGLSYDGATYRTAYDGASLATTASAAAPTSLTTLQLGRSASGTFPPNCYIPRALIFLSAMNDAQLAALTA